MPPLPINAAAPTPPGVALERGQTIDRFVVLGLVGRGGMGEVYAAYDPELDRKVAIKLLRARSGAANGRTRLLREAQAIAKLSHPNVVVVYDVGTFGDSVFIAMEFVEGNTVGYWLQAQRRPWREVLKVFLAAGEGLSAAHAAGLVHRDFKPDNVMLTKDGQVRVMDFGLARQVGGEERASPEGQGRAEADLLASSVGNAADTLDPSFDPESTADLTGEAPAAVATSSGRYLSLKLTQTGAMLGTPAYMAPEQFAMAPTDARTDQFSFCVALYEGLYGVRPFAGETFLSLMTAVTTGAIAEAPPRTRVPGWIRKVLLRGLQNQHEQRFPTMAALLAALQTDPTVRARRVAVTALAVACVAGLGLGARRVAGSHAAMCQGGGQRLAGIWEPGEGTSPRKEAIRRAFAATGKSYAATAFEGAARALNRYAKQWGGMYTEVCEATHVRGDQSAEVMDLRMACLQERLAGVQALTDVFAAADGRVVENAVTAAGSLQPLDGCADVALLKMVVKPPQDEAARRRVETLRADKARLLALRTAGHCPEAQQLAADLLPKVRAAGYGPLLAETLDGVAFVDDVCGELSSQAKHLRETYTVALAAHHDEVAANAAVLLATVLADRARQVEEAQEWLSIGNAMLARIGGHALLRVWAIHAEAIIAGISGDGDAAVAAFRKARATLDKLVGPGSWSSFNLMTGEANALVVSRRYDEALLAGTSARDGLAHVLGPDHPLVAMASSNMGEVLNALGRYGEARQAFVRAADVWQRQHSDPYFISYAETGLGLAYLGEQQPAAAVAPLEAALRTRTEKQSAPELVGETRFALARALWSQPRGRARARALAQQARADYAQAKTAADSVARVDAWLRAPSERL